MPFADHCLSDCGNPLHFSFLMLPIKYCNGYSLTSIAFIDSSVDKCSCKTSSKQNSYHQNENLDPLNEIDFRKDPRLIYQGHRFVIYSCYS